MYKKAIKNALNTQDLTGFTYSLKWIANRYIVALTHNNANTSITKLNKQATALASVYHNVNIWGWIDNKTNELFIDISTSYASLSDAIKVAKDNNQIAIFDMAELKEIRLK